jgi:hypothetical protein
MKTRVIQDEPERPGRTPAETPVRRPVTRLRRSRLVLGVVGFALAVAVLLAVLVVALNA